MARQPISRTESVTEIEPAGDAASDAASAASSSECTSSLHPVC